VPASSLALELSAGCLLSITKAVLTNISVAGSAWRAQHEYDDILQLENATAAVINGAATPQSCGNVTLLRGIRVWTKDVNAALFEGGRLWSCKGHPKTLHPPNRTQRRYCTILQRHGLGG
jgi:hypothetical protein